MATEPPQTPVILPNGTMPLATQVAGHTFQEGTDAIGMLKDKTDNFVLKPLTKPICGEREKQFYEIFQKTNNPTLLTLKRLVPEYRGTIMTDISGRKVEFLKLTDLAHNMQQPCIMDIKVGKRTWDPLATKDKIRVEEEKYAACKKSIGLCIPGFQVYDLETGKLHRYSKDYGKKLNATTFRDTLRLFLNFKTAKCRKTIAQILMELQSIQKWIHTQTYYKLYSSSILIVYDAKKLEAILGENQLNCNSMNCVVSPHSQNPSNLNSHTVTRDSFEQKTNNQEKINDEIIRNGEKFQTVKSVTNDNCANMLDIQMNGGSGTKTWLHVKMIDFAHAFPSDDDSLDTNYIFGIDSLVEIFEEFLKECGYVRKNCTSED